MKKLLFFILLLLPLLVRSQNGITFEIEDLKKPDTLLEQTPNREVFRDLILEDFGINTYRDKSDIHVPYEIVAQCPISDSLVTYGYHSFFEGMYHAYANHRPFVLSPDMIWLLICQGFSQHVNQNAEQLRSYFVDFDGQISLVVVNDSVRLENPNSPWENVFPEFTKQMAAFTGQELMNTLTCNFTTTTSATKVASEITAMDAMKHYFEYKVVYPGCGIPQITLEGTPKDWKEVLKKAKFLKKYQLDWWIKELEPILKQFVRASKGRVKKKFWREMFRYHTNDIYGNRDIIDGWIVKFFPYDKEGYRNSLQSLTKSSNLPHEIVKVDFKHINLQSKKETSLELWAGFVGLKQNSKTFALRPEIAWMVGKKKMSDSTSVDNLSPKKLRYDDVFAGGIDIRVRSVPQSILQLKTIENLRIDFIDTIQIPEEMGQLKINYFEMTGTISKKEIERIDKLFPNTILEINHKRYHQK